MTLAELIVKLKLTGAAEVAEGMKAVKEEVKATGETANAAGHKIERNLIPSLKNVETVTKATESHLKNFGGTMNHVMNSFGRFIGIGAGVGGFLSAVFGEGAEKASIQFTELSARLEAITGNADDAARKLEFVQQVANPSNFTFKQLSEAAVTLEAFGINAERAIPTLARLGMAFGAGDVQLQMLTRAMGVMSAGKMPSSRVLSRFGLNKEMLTEEGVRFDKKGTLLSSATETLEALERIVTQKYGTMFAKMANTPGAKLASLQDAFQRFERTIGDGIMTVAGPSIEHLTKLVNGLGTSGIALDVVTQAAAGMNKLLGGRGEGDGMTRFLAQALSVIGALPEAASRFKDYIGSVWSVTVDNVSSIFNMIMAQSKTLLSTIIHEMARLLDNVFSKTPLGSLGLEKSLPAIPDVTKYTSNIKPLREYPSLEKTDLLSKQDDYFNRLQAALAVPIDNTLPNARGEFLNAGDPVKQTDLLAKIDRNTGKSADLLSLRASATGPGAAGVVGATAAELQGGAPSRRIVIDTVGAENAMRRAIKEIAQEVYSKGVGNGMNRRAV